MLCSGIGTEFTPVDLDLSGLTIAVVKPPVSIPTAEAYSMVSPAIPPVRIADTLTLKVSEWLGCLKNAFEKSIFPTHPSLAAIKSELSNLGAIYTAMSGSGSAIFGLFKSDILADRLTQLFPGSGIFVATL